MESSLAPGAAIGNLESFSATVPIDPVTWLADWQSKTRQKLLTSEIVSRDVRIYSFRAAFYLFRQRLRNSG